MEPLNFLSFEFFIMAVVLLAVVAIVIAVTGKWLRLALIGLFALHLPLLYVGLVNLLGHGKPMEWETKTLAEKARVIAYDFEVGKAIYIWLRVPNEPAPRYYVMQWDNDMVQRMNQAKRLAEQQQTGVIMQMTEVATHTPEGFDVGIEPMFYAQPQPETPPKSYD